MRILSDLDAQQDRLRQRDQHLEDTRWQLDSGAQGRDAALAEARKRADELGILAGTLPAEGQGCHRDHPGHARRSRREVLDAVEELRGAGAEAMQIAGARRRPRSASSRPPTSSTVTARAGGRRRG